MGLQSQGVSNVVCWSPAKRTAQFEAWHTGWWWRRRWGPHRQMGTGWRWLNALDSNMTSCQWFCSAVMMPSRTTGCSTTKGENRDSHSFELNARVFYETGRFEIKLIDSMMKVNTKQMLLIFSLKFYHPTFFFYNFFYLLFVFFLHIESQYLYF